jgi:hypothetical protein
VAQQEKTDRTIGLAKVLAWPLIALIGIVYFAGPIKDQLIAGKIESLKIGSLELNLRESDIAEVPDRSLALALAGLSEAAIVSLLFAEPNVAYTQCQGHTDRGEFDEETIRPFKDLEVRGLGTAKQERSGTGADNDLCLTLDLTDQGARARTFVLDLISAQLKTAKVR